MSTRTRAVGAAVTAAGWVAVVLAPPLALAPGLGWWSAPGGPATIGLACLAVVPAGVLALWTVRRRHVLLRGWAQAVAATGLLLVLPVVTVASLAAPGGTAPATPWPWPVLVPGVLVAALVGLPTLAAMRELAVVGRGTPLPHDPPERLVTSGPYAYVRNPMQVSIAGSYVVAAVLLAQPLLLLGAAGAVAFSAVAAEAQERAAMGPAFGSAWARYHAGVRPWVPRWRPWPGRAVGALTVAVGGVGEDGGRGGGRDPWSALAGWFGSRPTTGLDVRTVRRSPSGGPRLVYEADGVRAHGPEAFGRALDHAHLAWAALGWVVLLPLPDPGRARRGAAVASHPGRQQRRSVPW